MSERPVSDDPADDPRIGRRRFIGAGLAGAGAVLAGGAVRPAAAAAQGATPPAAPSASGPVGQLPLRDRYPDLPAIPLAPEGTADTLAKLEIREAQVTLAKQGLTRPYAIGGSTRTAYEWLYGARPAGAPPSLDGPEQFSIGWTTFPDVAREGSAHLPRWTASLTDADAATDQFWPMIAEHGTGYNLLLPARVTKASARALRRTFGGAWSRALDRRAAAGDLYVIDLSLFEALEPQTVAGAPRFTPATVTLLTRSRRSGRLRPVAVAVSGHRGRGRRVYARGQASDGAWLYALQAAKTSITVYGVWLGHVYHWHIVTAAMQMAMFNTLPDGHPVREVLAPQSNYLIAFDQVLLELWADTAPPTSLSTSDQFLALCDAYAKGRSFFDDDPKPTIRRLGLRAADFTADERWDRYPVAQRLLTVWDLVERYVTACVEASYGSDAAVAGDAALQAWIATASAADGGNVRGLPAMDGRAPLIRVLTSLIYRVSVHGVSRLLSTSSPALTFAANFPHCLQRTDIPHPRAKADTAQLLGYLPNVETIGEALTFYFTFTFSTPYEPFIPLGGPSSELFFPGGAGARRNRALVELRRGLARFIEGYQPDMPQRFQWPRNIET